MINRIKVGMASCGIAAGADEVMDFLQEKIDDIEIVEVGCIGHCYAEPLVEVETDQGSVIYRDVEANEEYLNKILNLESDSRLDRNSDRYTKEYKKVTKLAGKIDPVNINEYRENGGYEALEKARDMSPEEVIKEVEKSQLRGRGGAGFPTHLKWKFLADKDADEKVLICNADEGDPGAFMDRSMMESVPHQVLEGMLIGAYATGATQLFIYCRAEYPLAVKNLNKAIEQVKESGLNKFEGKTIDIMVKEGAGAFVCGEETAMIHSLEGGRGTPRYRPPYPTDEGYKGYPTLINNVETLSNIPILIDEGGEEYAKLGTEGSKGTKLFALAGDLKYTGLVEVPMGITIGEVIYDIGGAEKGSVKGVQIGGPSGGCIPAEHFDTPVDYDSLESLGAIMGSGGLITIDNERCMVETARYFLEFTAKESCGKCTFCRVGNRRLLEMLEKITEGRGVPGDIDKIKDLGDKIKKGSLCGLGQTAPNPVLSTLRYYEDEYRAHVEDKECPALVCNSLVKIEIDHDVCIECGQCIKNCPVDAISDELKIDHGSCTRCNTCIEVCPVDAISRVTGGGDISE
ncbi:MAG: NADH-ubiquinone oxidoreductase-F iron-sulfur binding region domain-containing protein [Bacillota bacterium]